MNLNSSNSKVTTLESEEFRFIPYWILGQAWRPKLVTRPLVTLGSNIESKDGNTMLTMYFNCSIPGNIGERASLTKS